MARHGAGGGTAWSPAVVARDARRLLGRLRVPAVSLLLALTLLVGPGGPLAAGLGIGPDLARARAAAGTGGGTPNLFDPTGNLTSTLHFPPAGTSANAPAGTPPADPPRRRGALRAGDVGA